MDEVYDVIVLGTGLKVSICCVCIAWHEGVVTLINDDICLQFGLSADDVAPFFLPAEQN